jgi:hypothetical protein
MKTLLPILILILSLSVFGQTTFQFQNNLDVLPVNYQGNTVIEIATAVSQLQESEKAELPKKDEFETSAEYTKRLEDYKSKQDLTVTPNKFVLVLNYQLAEYDADKQILSVRTVFTHLDSGTVTLVKSSSETSSYTANLSTRQ